jgi:ketosteroid isomerase-like protein
MPLCIVRRRSQRTKRSSRAGCCFYRGADHIVVFEGGRIVQRGTYEELLDAEGLFRTLALRQLA